MIFESDKNLIEIFRREKCYLVTTNHYEVDAEWVSKDRLRHFFRTLWPTVMKDVRRSSSGCPIIMMMQLCLAKLPSARQNGFLVIA